VGRFAPRRKERKSERPVTRDVNRG
jgi:hypothetical protein